MFDFRNKQLLLSSTTLTDLGFLTEAHCVYSEVGREILIGVYMSFKLQSIDAKHS